MTVWDKYMSVMNIAIRVKNSDNEHVSKNERRFFMRGCRKNKRYE